MQLDRVLASGRTGRFADDLALAVLGIAGEAPATLKLYFLRPAGNRTVLVASPSANGNNRSRAGRACRPGHLCTGGAALPADDAVRGHAGRLVDDEPAVQTAVQPASVIPLHWAAVEIALRPPGCAGSRRSARRCRMRCRARRRSSACAAARPSCRPALQKGRCAAIPR